MNQTSTTPKVKQLSSGNLEYFKNYFAASTSWPVLLTSDLCNLLFGNFPGIVGFAARSLMQPCFLAACGRRPAIARQVQIRNPKAVSFGHKVMIDDFSVLDPQGLAAELHFGNYVSVGKFSVVVAKKGQIILQDGVNIGSHCRIATESRIEIGESTLVAAYCYIGPGNHQRGDGPLIEQPMDIRGGVKIGKHCWIGTRATIMDGVTIGDNAVVGAHSFVNKDVPAGAVVAGCPASIIRA